MRKLYISLKAWLRALFAAKQVRRELKPGETPCFICIKPIKIVDARILQINFMRNEPPIRIAVMLCEDDFKWAEKFEGAAITIIKSRIEARYGNDASAE